MIAFSIRALPCFHLLQLYNTKIHMSVFESCTLRDKCSGQSSLCSNMYMFTENAAQLRFDCTVKSLKSRLSRYYGASIAVCLPV